MIRLPFTSVGLLALFVLSWSAQGQCSTSLDSLVRDVLATTFSHTALLADDEVIKFGVLNFDPNELVDLEDSNLGSAQSSQFRNALQQFALPLRRQSPRDERITYMGKLSYLSLKQEQASETASGVVTDRLHEQSMSAGAGVRFKQGLGHHWELVLEDWLTWMRYQNKADYNSPWLVQIAPIIDGVLTNIQVELLMVEPGVGLNYNFSGGETRYQLFSSYHYLRGYPLDPEMPAHEAHPEAGYWTNGLALRRPFPFADSGRHSLWLRLDRTDLRGDLDGVMGASRYYQMGMAWLFDAHDAFGFVKNFGVGININYGSNLSGGTLILMYNFDGYR